MGLSLARDVRSSWLAQGSSSALGRAAFSSILSPRMRAARAICKLARGASLVARVKADRKLTATCESAAPIVLAGWRDRRPRAAQQCDIEDRMGRLPPLFMLAIVSP